MEMLTWKDGLTTILLAAAIAVMLAVTQAWGWPALGSYRTGALVLGLLGLGMCAGGAVEGRRRSRVYSTTMAVLGSSALVLLIWGIIAGTEAVFLALGATIGVMWIASTIGHALGYGAAPRPAKEVRPPYERIAA